MAEVEQQEQSHAQIDDSGDSGAQAQQQEPLKPGDMVDGKKVIGKFSSLVYLCMFPSISLV